ncbi:SCO family protein [Photobacterium angustum]|uniref:Electron transport protein SCO1/SenC n=1 Tax=Photobacterium angustum (strain S14 / CCUG 15956) TaxID=314292 RepID=Q1ZQK3_PHOAS|nr:MULTISPECIES: SCO family protein [Photobacterium]EAS64294.1 Electron transport protein SCO1/SenC [Photobacterium angustum S14]KJG03407.1 electron transporter [Photobacterium angustum]PSV03308.1 SCO family protein [Photobacterium leiognathi subsp. mandapamensis]PSV67280.1 SCO family protein [Photobacterium angustum]PSW78766.1 SCO family protein [Photobacterium angustum]
MTKNPVKIVLLLGALALAGIFALYINNSTTPIGEKQKALKDLGGEFQLNSLDGTVNLNQFKGQTVVLYFGFLNCAEVCPSSMGVMATAFSMLPPEEYANVQGIFISVDPGRDDLDSLDKFAKHFDNRIKGLTGTKEEIDALTEQYGVYFDLVDMESSELSYTVDHASRFYIINPEGKLVDAMSHTTTPIELAAGIDRAHSNALANN